jgi:hypothetical protein
MSEKLFFSQELINTWTDDEKVIFENDVLYINTSSGKKEYRLTPASRFLKISGDEPDPHGVLEKVFTQKELEGKGADVYLNSAIIGETAYEVEPGYVAVKTEDERSLEELLMEYLAKTL